MRVCAFLRPRFHFLLCMLVNLCVSRFLFLSSARKHVFVYFIGPIFSISVCKTHSRWYITDWNFTNSGRSYYCGDILENSTLQDQCSKCGYDIKSDDLVPCIGSKCGTLGRGKYFHKKCLPQEADYSKYLCEICDPKTRQDFCQKPLCKRPYNASCLECRHNCKRYIHRECIQGGLYIENWYCGVCQIAVK